MFFTTSSVLSETLTEVEKSRGLFMFATAGEGEMSIGLRANGNSIRLPRPLKVLTPEQVAEIDRALEEVGPFGEVRLVKAKGKVRFIQRLESRELPRGGEEEAG